MPDDIHEHDYEYLGMTYKYGDQIPGGGSREVEYFHTFFCKKCTKFRHNSVGVQHDSYAATKHNATPQEEIQRVRF